MTLAGNLLLNFYSIAVLVYIMVYSRMNTGRKDRSYRLFMDAVYILFIMLIADCMGRLDGRPDTWFAPLNQAGNFLTYLLNPVIAMVWLLYVHAQTGRTRLQTRRLQHVLIGIFVVQAALTLATLWTGWFYRIDADNVYHRGPLYLMSVLLPALLILAAEAFVWYERKRIARAHLFSLLFFPVLPFVFLFVSARLYGVSLILNGTALSVLIVFFSIQNRSINTDYLTGLYNRQKLESMLRDRVDNSIVRTKFAAILIDLDAFKKINDTHGHAVGDRALVSAATVLRSCFRANDFVARYGGDEFFVLFDTGDEAVLQAAIERVNRAAETFNRENHELYTLSFSTGSGLYNLENGQAVHVDTLLHQLDERLYQEKRVKKEACAAPEPAG